MSAFYRAVVLFGFVSQFVNSTFLTRIPHIYKILFIASSWLVAYLLYFTAFKVPKDLGFMLTLLGSSLQGAFNTVASNSVLGYMKELPPGCIAGYSMGNGLSGLSASFFYLFSSTYLDFEYILLLLIPTSFAYVGSFVWLMRINNRI